MNYGGIGAVIGHEISHGFDDQGSKYNGDGVLASWWTDTDRKEFEARTTKLVAQFDAYEALPGPACERQVHAGRRTIGDLSGMAISLKAYHISLEGKPAPVLDGFTGDQRFFWASRRSGAASTGTACCARRCSPTSTRRRCSASSARRATTMPGTKPSTLKPGDKLYIAPEDRVKLW